MTSRLDRLFILLESGSSGVTRRAAAKQIGEVQKLYPQELHILLNRLIGYLHSSTWDTRIAAAQAIEAVLINVPEWTPELYSNTSGVIREVKKEDDLEDDSNQSSCSAATTSTNFSTSTDVKKNFLTFAHFDVENILKKGARLIGSEGIEFDFNDDVAATSGNVAECLSRQRALINEKLGLTQASKLGINLTDMISEEDFKNTNSTYNINEQKIPVENLLKVKTSPKIISTNKQQLSCREMNRAKRKARQSMNTVNITATTTTTTSLSRSNSTQGNNNSTTIKDEPEKKKLKTDRQRQEQFYSFNDPVPDATGGWVDTNNWPLENFCTRLYLDIFNPKWEVRHGAATALRELIKNKSQGAGKSIYMSQEEMKQSHSLWLEDAALRMLCVLCLDRFGDFVSDQVVAPVRETCAQVLGTIVKELEYKKVNQIVQILLKLIKQKEWEVRHGGMLGFKYVFVVREDLLQIYLPQTVTHIMLGLFDAVDDVSAVAASTLIPVAAYLPKLLNPGEVSSIVKVLWDLLLDQDELTSACNSYMGLLAGILCLPKAIYWIQMEPMYILIPRLWPFLSHSSTSVRKSTLITLKTLTVTNLEKNCTSNIESNTSVSEKIDLKTLNLNFGVIDWPWKLLQDGLRHIFQRILVEPQAEIQEIAVDVWLNLIKNANLSSLLIAACPLVSSWMCLAMQPAKLAFEPTAFLSPQPQPTSTTVTADISRRRPQRIGDDLGSAKLSASSSIQKLYLGGSESTPLDVRERNVMRARILASRVIGELSKYLVLPAPGVNYSASVESPIDCYTRVILSYLNSRSAVQRLIAALILAFWAQCDPTARNTSKIIQKKLCFCVLENIYYDEVVLSITRLHQDARDFISTLKEYKIPINSLENSPIIALDQIQAVATTLTEDLHNYQLRPKIVTRLEERRKELQTLFQQVSAEYTAYNITTQAALAGGIVCLHSLPEKLNPVVKPLMESIKYEDCTLLQELSADFLVQLMEQVCDRHPSPNSKIFKNLCMLLKSDIEFTPEIQIPNLTLSQTATPNVANSKCPYFGILTLNMQQNTSILGSSGSGSRGPGRPVHSDSTAPTTSRGPGRPPLKDSSQDSIVATTDNGKIANGLTGPELKQRRTQRLGAARAIVKLCSIFGADLIKKLPTFEQIMFENIKESTHSTMEVLASTLPDFKETNDLMTSLQLTEIAAPYIDSSFQTKLLEMLPHLGMLIMHPLKAIRHMVARCIATMAVINTCHGPAMDYVVNNLIVMLRNIRNVTERQGAVEAIECVVEKMQIKIVPYIVLLIVPLLGSMSDPDESVRLMATHCFATLIQLMPLDSKANCVKNEIQSKELQERKSRDREFLDYLFAPKTIPDYKVPVPLSVDLRTYQQAGVNWLWFLNKYNLHGILCDDMGLGKTLQTICILAGDHYQRSVDKAVFLPSIVICPPTLTGHWVYEVEKFLKDSKVLVPLHYIGLPIGREKLRCFIGTCNLVITSYDTIRKDIEFFNMIHWNYVVLDEGHIIKNGKTKSSKAIKMLRANHRLILSGTPIQNNVLELWSLFDFLMPGFLGTEKQFIARYSRPILASRDPKSSPKEQEAGVLAMESLHRQVLPFLLRRVKEDVLTDLPPKITQDLLCELSPLQERLYEDFSKSHLNSDLKDCLKNLGDSNNLNPKPHIFHALRYLQNVCNHPKLVLTPKHPEFTRITQELLQNQNSLDDIEHSAKLPVLKQLLLDCGIGQTESVSQHRALIFCQLKAMLDIVEKDLLCKHMPSVTYSRLDGSVPTSSRQDIVNEFNSDPSIDVLLLTTQVGGLGLNLTGADTVIFVEHDWNPMKDLQAMDRAHRIGQKKVVNVYRLITRKSLEEKIMGLQKFKILTANTVVSSDNASMETMGTEQIFDLFNLNEVQNNDKFGTANRTGTGNLSMNVIIENLPELWSEQQYDEEYDLSNFLQALKRN